MARRLAAARLIVASHNAGKAREIAALLRPLGIEAVGAATLGLAEPEETGDTFGANAALKARAAAAASGEPALADDSGLVVPALDGAPGIYSARWAGPGKDFRVAMTRIETELAARGCEPVGAAAYFVCALSLGWPDDHCETVEGRVDGTLAFPPPRPTRLRLRPDLRSRRPRAHLRRDGAGREAAADPQGAGLRATGGGPKAGPVVIGEPEPSSPGAPQALALYVHWPFCLSKCPYCDFNSHVRESVDQARWRGALLRELDHFSALLPGAQVTSMFFGGGTPSLMPPETAGAVIDRAVARWTLAADAEITLEANPTSTEAARLEDFRAAGVNRVSLGVQALDDRALTFLGRGHDATEARRAVALAQSIMPRSSFDLIYARPGQTVDAWRAELAEALAFADDHLSLYQLTIEKGTPFWRLERDGALALPDDDTARALYDLTQEMTAAAGFAAYEVSNHERGGNASRHNLAYWRYDDYVGIGPGAHGRFAPAGCGRQAVRQHAGPETWLAAVEGAGHGTAETRSLDADEQAREMLMMGLRLAEGVSEARLRARTGCDPDRVIDRAGLARLIDAGYLERRDGKLTRDRRRPAAPQQPVGRASRLSGGRG